MGSPLTNPEGIPYNPYPQIETDPLAIDKILGEQFPPTEVGARQRQYKLRSIPDALTDTTGPLSGHGEPDFAATRALLTGQQPLPDYGLDKPAIQEHYGVKPSSRDGIGYNIKRFLSSAISSGGKEMIGFDPDFDDSYWRDKNPGWGMLSHLVGGAPFLLPLAPMFGLGLVSKFDKGLKLIEKADTIEGYFRKGAALETLRYAPFQTGRLALSTLAAPFGANPVDTFKSVAIETPFIAAGGGLFGKEGVLAHKVGTPRLRSAEVGGEHYGTEVRLSRELPHYDPDWHMQKKLEVLEELEQQIADGKVRPSVDDEAIHRLMGHWKKQVRAQTPATVGAYHGIKSPNNMYSGPVHVWGSEAGPIGEGTQQVIDSLWKGQKHIASRRLLQNGTRHDTPTSQARVAGGGSPPVEDGFSAEEIIAANQRWGEVMPNNAEAHSLYQREFRPRDEKGLERMHEILRDHFRPMWDGKNKVMGWVAHELEDPAGGGLSHVIKQSFDNATGQHVFYGAKTPKPSKFFAGAKSTQDAVDHLYLRGKVDHGFMGLPTNDEEAKYYIQMLKDRGTTKFREKGQLEKEFVERNPGPGTNIRDFDKKTDIDINWNPRSKEQIQYVQKASYRRQYEAQQKGSVPGLYRMKALADLLPIGMGGGLIGKRPFPVKNGLSDTRFRWTQWIDEMLPEHLSKARVEATNHLKDYGFELSKAIAPARLQFGRSNRAVGYWQLSQDMYDIERDAMNVMLHGKYTKLGPEEGWFGQRVLRGKTHDGKGLLSKVQRPWDEGHGMEMTIALRRAYTAEKAASEGMNPVVVTALKDLRAAMNKATFELKSQRTVLGLDDDILPNENHLPLSMTYQGDFRTPIYDEVGNVIALGSGNSSKDARLQANEMIEELAKLNKRLEAEGQPSFGEISLKSTDPTQDGTYSLTQRIQQGLEQGKYNGRRHYETFEIGQHAARLEDPSKPIVRALTEIRGNLLMRPHKGQSFLGRKGGGYPEQLMPQEEMKWKDVEQLVSQAFIDTQKIIAFEGSRALLGKDLLRLYSEDPNVAKQVIDRVNALYGMQGRLNAAIDRVVDDKFGHVFGAGAARKLVHGVNEVFYFLTLGALDAGFVTVNALSPIQTVLPEIAYVTGIPHEKLASVYSKALWIDKTGNVRRMSYLDNFKVMRDGWDMLQNPTAVEKEMLDRGLREGSIARQFMEAIVGEDSQIMQELLKGNYWTHGGGIGGNLLKASFAPVAISEQFARGYSFATGYRLAKKVWGFDDEKAFVFAKRFTERTNFDYTAAGRPKTLTGLFGTGLGLFKNWTFNYMGNLLNYSGAAMRGNFQPLLLAMAGTGAIGGFAAMPFSGAMDNLAEMMTDKTAMDMMYDHMGFGDSTIVPDVFAYGVPSLMGITLQPRSAAPGAQIMRDFNMLFNAIHMRRAGFLGDMVQSGASMASQGINPWSSSQFMRNFVGAFAPRTLQRIYGQMAQDGIMSLNTGNKLMPNMNWFHSTLHAFGLTALEYEKQMDAENQLYNDAKAYREKVQWYGTAIAEADSREDYGLSNEIWRKAMLDNVSLPSVQASADSRLYKKFSGHVDRTFERYQVNQLEQSRNLISGWGM